MTRTGLGLTSPLLPPKAFSSTKNSLLRRLTIDVNKETQPTRMSTEEIAEIVVDSITLKHLINRNTLNKNNGLLADGLATTCDTQTPEGYKVLPFGSIGISSRGTIVLNLNRSSQASAFIFNSKAITDSDNFENYSFSNNIHKFTYTYENKKYNFEISLGSNKNFKITNSEQNYECHGGSFQSESGISIPVSSSISSEALKETSPDIKVAQTSLAISASPDIKAPQTSLAISAGPEGTSPDISAISASSSSNDFKDISTSLSGYSLSIPFTTSVISFDNDCISIKLKGSQEYRFLCSEIFSFFPAKLNEYLEKNLSNASFAGFLESTAEYLRISNGNCSFSSSYQKEGDKEDLIKFNQSLIKLAKNSTDQYCQAFNEQILNLDQFISDEDNLDEKNKKLLAIALTIPIACSFLIGLGIYRIFSDKKEKENNRIRQQKDIKLRAERLDNRMESVEVAV